MRLTALVFAGILVASSAAAQPDQASSAAGVASPETDGTTAKLDLPVSLDKIRSALERPASGRLSKGLEDKPTFRVEILERQRMKELLATLDFKSGPSPAGGIYGYEQQRMLFPASDYPSEQPFGAFNQGQLLTLLIENLVGKYAASRAVDALVKSAHEHTESTVRREVAEAIEEYCASKANGGAGIELCELPPTTR